MFRRLKQASIQIPGIPVNTFYQGLLKGTLNHSFEVDGYFVKMTAKSDDLIKITKMDIDMTGFSNSEQTLLFKWYSSKNQWMWNDGSSWNVVESPHIYNWIALLVSD